MMSRDQQRRAKAPETLPSRRLSEADKFYLEQATKEPVEATTRIEETAKYLIGATATSAGMFAAASKLALGKDPAPDVSWFLPFVFWVISILVLIFALLPNRYEVVSDSPEDFRAFLLEARDRKWRRLGLGAGLYCVGLLSATIPFST
ncbi:MAG: hypothetical protein AAF533_14175 [Acidobacteriota bacterium]